MVPVAEYEGSVADDGSDDSRYFRGNPADLFGFDGHVSPGHVSPGHVGDGAEGAAEEVPEVDVDEVTSGLSLSDDGE